MQVVLKDCLKTNQLSDFDRLLSKCGDGKEKRIFQCRSKRPCILNKNFIARDSCVSSSTLRSYSCVVRPGTTYLDCYAQPCLFNYM